MLAPAAELAAKGFCPLLSLFHEARVPARRFAIKRDRITDAMARLNISSLINPRRPAKRFKGQQALHLIIEERRPSGGKQG